MCGESEKVNEMVNVCMCDNKVYGEYKLIALFEVFARERVTRSLMCCFEDEGFLEDVVFVMIV